VVGPGQRAGDRASRPPRQGYTLVALVILIAVMGIATAIVLPLWSSVIQRERERQLIFRGAQYAEAIRVFQARFGRLPVKLEELLEVEPRSIRQLWDDPMTDDGRWELMRQVGQGGTPGEDGGAPGIGGGTVGGQRGQTGSGDAGSGGAASDLPGSGSAPQLGPLGTGSGEEVSIGPIAGVHSRSEDSGFRLFLDREQYNRWEFTPDLFPPAVGADGSPRTPHLGTDWIGRAPPESQLEGGETPEDSFEEAFEDSIEKLGKGDNP